MAIDLAEKSNGPTPELLASSPPDNSKWCACAQGHGHGDCPRRERSHQVRSLPPVLGSNVTVAVREQDGVSSRPAQPGLTEGEQATGPGSTGRKDSQPVWGIMGGCFPPGRPH